jgi:hypothetical protein
MWNDSMILYSRKAQLMERKDMTGKWREDENGEIMMVPVAETQNPNVGIFWIIETERDEDIIYDAVLVSQGEKYGENLKPKSPAEVLFKSKPYDAFPRGRIVFFPAKKLFIIYVDRCISAEELSQIMDKFEIDDFAFTVKEDEHYRCAESNPHFVDI